MIISSKKRCRLFGGSLAPILFSSFSPVGDVGAFPFFRDAIPNGFRVPNPEPQGGVWAGIGHTNTGGGGPLNAFGRDFLASGSQWTVELCEKDSDGDGRSNGIELGDPDCVWKLGLDPDGPAVSHPGIVDDVQADGDTLLDSCIGYEKPTDAVDLAVQFSVPNVLNGTVRTTYICEQIPLTTIPVEGVMEYHLIRSQVFDNHPSVLHHMILYECDGTSSDGNQVGDGPYECSGMENRCSLLTGWGLGRLPTCEPPNVGLEFNFRPDKAKVLKLEAHYDDARLAGATDQSGMLLTITPNLRPHASGLVRFGLGLPDANFDLPPQESEVVSRVGTCPGEVTMQLPHAIWAYAWFPHMHYVGTSMVTQHFRCGVQIGTIGNIPRFEFDNQQLYSFDAPIKILPGDVFRTTCGYNTSQASTVIQGGTETSDEMCYNFIYYYPNVQNSHMNDDEEGDIKDFFGTCFSFDIGIKEAWLPLMFGAIPTHTTRFATMNDGNGGWAVQLNYTSDPEISINACCSDDGNASACETLYLSEILGPCGQDEDCKSDYCHQGVCREEGFGETASSAPAMFSWTLTIGLLLLAWKME